MALIQDYILIFAAILLLLGWWVHNWTVLARLTRIKGRRITLAWFIRNRPYKLRISATSSIVSGFIAFVWFDPIAMDLATKAGREGLAIYMSALFSIGLGADFIVDQVGSRAKTGKRVNYHDEHEPDDGKSLFLSEKERGKILEEIERDAKK